MSVLNEVDSRKLDEIFSTSALNRTDEEMMIVVRVLREQRAMWAQEEAQGKKRSSAAKKPPRSQQPVASISLADFGELSMDDF